MNQKRIAYLVSQYPAISHTFIAREIHFLRSLDFDIKVASINNCFFPPDSLSMEEQKDISTTFYVKANAWNHLLPAIFYALFQHPLGFLNGVKEALCSGGWDFKLHLYWIFYLLEAFIVGHWMEQNQFKHLHVHFANPASNVGLLLTKVYPFTFSMTIHGPDEFYDVTRNALPKKIEAAHFVICISHYAHSQVMRLSNPAIWHKFEIAQLGVDPDIYFPLTRLSNEIPVILCVGRLTPTKGQYVLLSAISRLIKKNIKVNLILVGDGPSRKELEEAVYELKLTSYVEFKGALSPAQTLAEFRMADIFALASFAEGLPVVLMEAMSMEIPCVASCINGVPELIQDQINGILIPPADIDSLVSALENLLSDVNLRTKIAVAGRQRILKCYSLKHNTQRLADIFKARLE